MVFLSVIALVAMSMAFQPLVGTATADSTEAVDTVGDVGQWSSLALDAAGNPVVAYYDVTNKDLKVVHCNDPACAGGDESIESPDTTGNVGQYASLALDPAGNPVVAYHDVTNGDLKVLHCDDPDCTGTGDTIEVPDAPGRVGLYAALRLDAGGNPVVAYYDDTNDDLKVLRCNDANCADADESIESPDATGDVGLFASMILDASGYPVVAYRDATNRDLKLLHCNDANCAGGDDPTTSPDTSGNVGVFTSIALDAAGNPVVSHYETTFDGLHILHCDDPDCATGGDSIETPDTTGDVGSDSSLVLDADGNPIVSYRDATNGQLKILRCNDPDCAPGSDSIRVADDVGDVGYTSLELDANGDPVVSYYDVGGGNLRVFHGDPLCVALPQPAALAGWWDFDDDFGDKGGAYPDGVSTGADATLDPAGHVRGAAAFSGGNVAVSDADLGLGAGDLSVDLWVARGAGSAGTEALVAHRAADVGSAGFLVSLTDGVPAIQLWDGAAAVDVAATTSTVPDDGDFHLLVVTVSGAGDVTFYVDDSTPETIASTGTGERDSANSELVFGADFDGTEPFSGALDEVELYRAVLTPTEVMALYDADTFGKCEPTAFCLGAPVTVDWAVDQSTTSGPDVILGTAGNDIIAGFGGNDLICGQGGNDIITGGGGNDIITGGAGNDTIIGHPGDDIIRGDAGIDNINGGAGDDSIDGGGDSDTIVGGPGDDEANGGAGNDDVNGAVGDDIVRGGGGDDSLRGAGGDDELRGGDGDDPLLSGGAGTDAIFGGSGNDVLQGNKGHGDALNGEAGDDSLNGGVGNDALDGGGDTDLCNGGSDGHTDTAVNCETELNIP